MAGDLTVPDMLKLCRDRKGRWHWPSNGADQVMVVSLSSSRPRAERSDRDRIPQTGFSSPSVPLGNEAEIEGFPILEHIMPGEEVALVLRIPKR